MAPSIHSYRTAGRPEKQAGVPSRYSMEQKNWFIGFRLGVNKEGGTEGREYLNGYRLAPYRPEVMAVTNGFNGLSAFNMDDTFSGMTGRKNDHLCPIKIH